MLRQVSLAIALGVAPVAASAQSASFSSIYVLGDSLSDNGNLASNAILPTTFPEPPFFNNSFTNGDVAVQVLAGRFGLTADAARFASTRPNPAGTNYAVAGATAGNALGQGVPGFNLATQAGVLLTRLGGAVPMDALVTVFIGGNDVRTAARQSTDPDSFDATYITEGVNVELAAIQTLINAGARNLLVVNVPNVGAIPEFNTGGAAGRSVGGTAASQAYNSGLLTGVGGLQLQNAAASIRLFDLYGFGERIAANPGAFGLSNITDACYPRYDVVAGGPAPAPNAACGPATGPGGFAANIDGFLYWDEIHPTARVHAAFGNALADFLGAAAVPEPATWATMVLGFGVAGAAVRRRRAAVRLAA